MRLGPNMVSRSTYAVSLALALFVGAAVDHYQWVPYKQFIRQLRNKQDHSQAEAMAVASHVKSKTEFFRQSIEPAEIVMLGDSLTEQAGDWKDFFPHWNVRNRGIAGDTAEGVLGRIDPILQMKPRFVLVMIGINDIRMDRDVEAVFERIATTLAKIKQSEAAPIMQSTLLTVDEPVTNGRVKLLNERLRQWCLANDVLFVDLNTTMSPSGSLEKRLSKDGYHLNFEGYLEWRDRLLPVLHQATADKG